MISHTGKKNTGTNAGQTWERKEKEEAALMYFSNVTNSTGGPSLLNSRLLYRKV